MQAFCTVWTAQAETSLMVGRTSPRITIQRSGSRTMAAELGRTSGTTERSTPAMSAVRYLLTTCTPGKPAPAATPAHSPLSSALLSAPGARSGLAGAADGVLGQHGEAVGGRDGAEHLHLQVPGPLPRRRLLAGRVPRGALRWTSPVPLMLSWVAVTRSRRRYTDGLACHLTSPRRLEQM